MHFPSLIGTFDTLKVIEVFPDVHAIHVEFNVVSINLSTHHDILHELG